MKSKKQQKGQILEQPLIIALTRQQKLAIFLQKAQNNITVMIDTDKIKIPNQKIPFHINQSKQSAEYQVLAEKLKTIQLNKQLMQSKLKSISEEYRELQLRHRQAERRTGQSRINEKMQNSLIMRQKSQLKVEDIMLLKKLKKEYKQFEQSLQSKTKGYEENMNNIKRQQQQLFQRKIKEKNQVKRKQITKKLQQLAVRKKQKQKCYEEEKKKMLEIKTKKKLYEQMQQKQKIFLKQEMEKKIQEMQQRFQQRHVNFQDLKDHSQKYRQMRQKWKQQRLKKQQEYQQLQRQRKNELRSCQKSKYYTIVVKQKNIQKIEEDRKLKKKLQLIESAKQYAQIVKRQHVPKVKTKQDEQQNKLNKVQGLSFEQQKSIGNNYLQYVKKMLKKRQANKTTLASKGNSTQFMDRSNQSKLSNQNIIIKADSTTNSMKYRDYLSQRRSNKVGRSDMGNSSGYGKQIKNSFIRRQLQDVSKIMSSTGNKHDKLQQIKYITKKIEQKDNKEDYILDKISAKLKILQTLSNYQ